MVTNLIAVTMLQCIQTSNHYLHILGFPGGSVSKESTCSAGDPGSIPGLGRSPGEGNSNLLHFLAWEIPLTEETGGLQSIRSRESDTS